MLNATYLSSPSEEQTCDYKIFPLFNKMEDCTTATKKGHFFIEKKFRLRVTVLDELNENLKLTEMPCTNAAFTLWVNLHEVVDSYTKIMWNKTLMFFEHNWCTINYLQL